MADLEFRKKIYNENFVKRDVINKYSLNEDETDKLRLLFVSCDSDKDGKLSHNDLIRFCQHLNMNDLIEDILAVVGSDCISFEEFLHCRKKVLEINQINSPEYLIHSPYYSHPNSGSTKNDSCSDLSAVYSCADSTENPGVTNESTNSQKEETPLSLQAMIQQCQPDLYNRFCHVEYELTSNGKNYGQQILQIANQIYLSRINRLYNELKNSVKRITSSHTSKDLCQKELIRVQTERDQLKSELDNQTSRYEDRLTELHSVIAELHKKIDNSTASLVIVEENEDDNIDEDEDDNNPGNYPTNRDKSRRDGALRALSTTEDGTEDYEKLDLQNHKHQHNNNSKLWSESMVNSTIDYRMISIQKDDNSAIGVAANNINPSAALCSSNVADDSKQIKTLQQTNLYLQEKLSSYESVVCNLRNQLSSILDEKENLRRQIREFQFAYDQQTTTQPSLTSSSYPPVSTSQSKISLDSKSTNSSSSSPARPIMGVRQQQTKQNQMKNQLSTGNEPDWVLKAVNKYHYHSHSHHQSNSNLSSASTCNIRQDDAVSNLSSNPSAIYPGNTSTSSDIQHQPHQQQPAIFLSGYLFLQQLIESIPYPSMIDPLHRIMLQWHKFVATYDRESADNSLLQSTLSETKAINDQLQCYLSQMQSEAAALAKSNQLADQQIDVMDILIQLQETSASSAEVCMETSIYHNSPNAGGPICNNKSTPPNFSTTSSSSSGSGSNYYCQNSSTRVRQSYRDQVETAAKLLLCRLNDYCPTTVASASTTSTTVASVDTKMRLLGRQTPDSGCPAGGNVTGSSTMSSGSVDHDHFSQKSIHPLNSNPISNLTWTNSDEIKLRQALESIIKQRNKVQQSIMGVYTTTDSQIMHFDIPLTTTTTHTKSSQSVQHSQGNLSSVFSYSPSSINNNHAHSHQSSATAYQTLETSILIQEVCMLKEERATLRTRIYLLEKDIYSLQLSLDGRITTEKLLRQQLDNNHHNSQQDAAATTIDVELLRDKFARYQTTSEEIITDLKQANAALISAFERSRKKYQSRILKLEQHQQQSQHYHNPPQDSIIIPPSEQTAL